MTNEKPKNYRDFLKGTKEFVTEGKDRMKSPTPLWFKWARWISGLLITPVGAAAALVAPPWTTVLTVAAGVLTGFYGMTWFPVKDGKITKKIKEAE